MNDSNRNRLIAIWGITVILVIGALLVLVAYLSGGDGADMEQQPDVVSSVVTSLAGPVTGAVG